MTLNEFLEFGSIVGNASVINETRFMIEEGREHLSEKDKIILKKSIEYLNKILNGYEFKYEEKYTRNLKDSINAFKHSKRALENIEKKDFKKFFKKLIVKSIKDLGNVLNKESLNVKDINKDTFIFFAEVGNHFLDEGFKHTKRGHKYFI